MARYLGIGVDFKIKQFTVGGKRFITYNWDTSGHERFRTLTSSVVPKRDILERADIRENGSKSPLLLLKTQILRSKSPLLLLKKPDLDIPLPMWLMCGLLKSKNNLIRWGFLFVLERVLMCCKFLLDENQLQHSVGNEDHEKTRLDKANVVIDIMSRLRAEHMIKWHCHGFLLRICSIHLALNGRTELLELLQRAVTEAGI
ncbi:hypothetical protein Tco_0422809 [Tanacetum coccineum]